MSASTLLSDLCSICNANTSKYRCPGCAARTCSLPCYKRHQQWAQCSGQRDPTKFVKKSQLVTPAGIDHDFNFLTGIERDLEKAEKAANASIGAQPGSQLTSRGQHSANQFDKYSRLEYVSGVTIIRAPKGMSRQKENNSHRSSTKRSTPNVQWTVEWLNYTRERVLTETSSTCPIAGADPFVEHKSKKRKLDAEAPQPTTSPRLQDAAISRTNQDKPLGSLDLELHLDGDTGQSQRLSAGQRTAPVIQDQEAKKSKADSHLADSHAPNHRPDGSVSQPMGDGRHRFFLLRPRTSSSRLVLIPIDPHHTLADCLHGRTVLEFPTIYVFPSAMPLPEEFMLEEEYIKQEGEEQRDFDELLRELDPEILKRLKEERPRDERAGEEEVDSKRILDVLKQDLGAAF